MIRNTMTQALQSYIEDHAQYYEDGMIDYTELAGLMLQADAEPNEATATIIEGLESIMVQYLMNPSPENSEQLLDEIRSNAMKYYDERMRKALEQEYTKQELAKYEDNGMYCDHDIVTGEPVWRRA